MKNKVTEVADLSLLKKELSREQSSARYRIVLRNIIFTIMSAAAVAVLIAMTFMPVFRIYGKSMTPTLNEGEIVIALKGSSFSQGDIVGLYVGNKLLVKRVIAGPGQWVDISDEGIVSVDGKELTEPYLKEKAYGEVNIKLPYQVPDERYFVMGDHRATSLDSRNTAVGCIAQEQIVGRILLIVWPWSSIGPVQDR